MSSAYPRMAASGVLSSWLMLATNWFLCWLAISRSSTVLASSRVRACTSSKRRVFSMAMTAWSAKVITSSTSRCENGATRLPCILLLFVGRIGERIFDPHGCTPERGPADQCAGSGQYRRRPLDLKIFGRMGAEARRETIIPIAHAIDDRLIRRAESRSRVDHALQHRLEVELRARDDT